MAKDEATIKGDDDDGNSGGGGEDATMEGLVSDT